MKVGTLPTYGNHLRDCIISLNGEIWGTSIYIEVSVTSHESGRQRIAALDVSIIYLLRSFLDWILKLYRVVYFLSFICLHTGTDN